MMSQAVSPNVFNRLADVIRDVFDCPNLTVTPETTSLDVDGWDSLTHTVLLLRLEKAFDVRLPLDRAGAAPNVGSLADLVQELTGCEPETEPVGTSRGWILLHGNCQMGFVSSMLTSLFAPHGYQVMHVPSFQKPGGPQQADAAQIATCAAFVEQVFPWNAEIPPTYKADLPSSCRQLRVPAFAMRSLWPFNTQQDPRNTPDPRYPWGKYPYGDTQALKLLRESTDPDVVFRRYMNTDIGALLDLDRLHEMAMTQAEAADKLADIPIAPIYQRHFRSDRLFDTVNHPSQDLLVLLRDVIAEFVLEGEGGSLPPAAPYPLSQVPIHPQIIEHFRLEWARPDTLYCYEGRWVTFEQYMRAYIAYE